MTPQLKAVLWEAVREWGIRLGLLAVGALGVMAFLPARLSRLEATVNSHLAWAATREREISEHLEEDHELIQALVRLRCLESDTKLIQAANLPCDRLLSNQVPGQ